MLEQTPEYFKRLAGSMEDASLIIASHPYCLPAILKCLNRQFLVYEAQDVEYCLKEEVLRKVGASRTGLLNVVREVEAKACRAGSLILCCSEADREELLRLYNVESDRIVLVPNGVDVEAVRFVSPTDRDHLKREFGLAGQSRLPSLWGVGIRPISKP